MFLAGPVSHSHLPLPSQGVNCDCSNPIMVACDGWFQSGPGTQLDQWV